LSSSASNSIKFVLKLSQHISQIRERQLSRQVSNSR
jgi:hypothetical protein